MKWGRVGLVAGPFAILRWHERRVLRALHQPFGITSVVSAALAFVTVFNVVHPQPEGKVKTTFINLGQVDGSFRWLAD